MQEEDNRKPERLELMGPVGIVAGAVNGVALTHLLINLPALHGDAYGYLLFFGIPFVIGLVTTMIAGRGGRPSPAVAFWLGVAALFVYALAMLALGQEGMICLLMAAPLAFLPVWAGTSTGLAILRRRDRTLLIPIFLVSMGALDGLRAPETVSEVRTAVVVDATPERAWREIVALGELPPPTDPFLCTGVACPVKTELRGTGVGAARHCTLTTGAMPERITVWEPARRLTFVALETPPMLREVNPFHTAEPPHLKGHYRVLQGEFVLDPLPGGRTRLWRTTRYAHRFGPAFYWTPWCDFGAERAHRYVLDVVKARAEADRMAKRP